MINLYIFNESSRAAVFGIGTYIRELARALQKMENISVSIIYLHSDKKDFELEETDGIKHWHFPASSQKSGNYNPRSRENFYGNIIYILRQYIETDNKLIFHLNFNHCGYFAEKLKEVFDCQVITVIHYSDWGFNIFGNMKQLNAMLTHEQPDDSTKQLQESVKNEALYYQKTDRVVSLSEYMKDILISHYKIEPEKISVIPNGLFDMVDHREKLRILKEKWMLGRKEKIIVFAGRIDKIKGISFLIQSFRNVLQQFPNCRLIIAGNGDYNIYMKEAKDICTKITFTGLLEKQELYELYRIADVGVVPSLYEPFGYVAVEMMMHKLPVVVTATSGLDEIVDETCGFKIPLIEHADKVETDTDLLAEKIIYLLKNQKEAKQLGRNGRKRYLKHYSSQVFGKNMLQFYNSL